MSSSDTLQRLRVIDSHTAGEPTRVVYSGGPDFGSGSMAERRKIFHEKFDEYRSAVVNEPRGSDVLVGAWLCEPVDSNCAAGVIFFNNVGPLWMCGHGTIGVAVTLGHLSRISKGTHRIETPVGEVSVDYDGANTVSFENVPSYRLATKVTVDVKGVGSVTGDIAWGGNWFFLVDTQTGGADVLKALHSHRSKQAKALGRKSTAAADLKSPTFGLGDVDLLTEITWKIRQALENNGITGKDGGVIDHIELFCPPGDPANHSRNFVLCPGRAYDRSPCGTGTSAKLACLVADKKLKAGQTWRQESILGTVFEGSIRRDGKQIIPRITGTAYLNAETTLILNPRDPFQMGIRSK